MNKRHESRLAKRELILLYSLSVSVFAFMCAFEHRTEYTEVIVAEFIDDTYWGAEDPGDIQIEDPNAPVPDPQPEVQKEPVDQIEIVDEPQPEPTEPSPDPEPVKTALAPTNIPKGDTAAKPKPPCTRFDYVWSGCEHLEDPNERLLCTRNRMSAFIGDALKKQSTGSFRENKVVTTFTIADNGGIENVRIRGKRPVSKSQDRIIRRALGRLPKLIPPKCDADQGQYVPGRSFRVPVKFVNR